MERGPVGFCCDAAEQVVCGLLKYREFSIMNAYDKATGMVTGWRAVSSLQQGMAELAVGEPQSESKRDEAAERQRWLPGRVEIVGVAQPWPLKA